MGAWWRTGACEASSPSPDSSASRWLLVTTPFRGLDGCGGTLVTLVPIQPLPSLCCVSVRLCVRLCLCLCVRVCGLWSARVVCVYLSNLFDFCEEAFPFFESQSHLLLLGGRGS